MCAYKAEGNIFKKSGLHLVRKSCLGKIVESEVTLGTKFAKEHQSKHWTKEINRESGKELEREEEEKEGERQEKDKLYLLIKQHLKEKNQSSIRRSTLSTWTFLFAALASRSPVMCHWRSSHHTSQARVDSWWCVKFWIKEMWYRIRSEESVKRRNEKATSLRGTTIGQGDSFEIQIPSRRGLGLSLFLFFWGLIHVRIDVFEKIKVSLLCVGAWRLLGPWKIPAAGGRAPLILLGGKLNLQCSVWALNSELS